MKLKNILAKVLVVGAAVLGTCASVQAQGDFDVYALVKTYSLFPVTNFASSGTGNFTNPYVDLHGDFIGSAYIDVQVLTNYTTNTLTVTPQQSLDATNWVNVVNYAISTNISSIITNVTYSAQTTNGTNGALLGTNLSIQPFIPTTPNAAAAGWGTPYPLPQPYTNAASYFTPNYNGMTRIGFQNVQDFYRYFRLVITNGGTNYFSATFNGRRRQGAY